MITPEQRLALEEKVVEMLRTVYDPEIPVDVYKEGERAKERPRRRNCTGDGDSESSPHLVT